MIDLAAPSAVARVALPAGHDARLAIPCWTAAGDLLVCSHSGSLAIVTADLARSMPIASPLRDPVHRLAADPAGRPRVAAVGRVNAIVPVPDPAAPRAVREPVMLDVGEDAAAVAWSHDASLVACGTRTGRVLLFDGATGAPRGALVPHERKVESLAFSHDGLMLVTADESCVRLSDVATHTTLDEIRPGFQVRTLRLDGGDRRLVLAGYAGDLHAPGGGRIAVMELDGP